MSAEHKDVGRIINTQWDGQNDPASIHDQSPEKRNQVARQQTVVTAADKLEAGTSRDLDEYVEWPEDSPYTITEPKMSQDTPAK